METRNAKLIVNKSGGTASGKSKTYRVTLPNSWINQMGLGELNREIDLYFDGERVIVTRKTDIEEFVHARKHHKLIQLDYYNFDDLITTIIADYTDEVIKIKNHKDDIIHSAFGVRTNPSWDDYLEFLEDRCISRTRDGLKYYLDTIGVDEYNPFEIIKKTQGRMSEDHQWIKISYLSD